MPATSCSRGSRLPRTSRFTISAIVAMYSAARSRSFPTISSSSSFDSWPLSLASKILKRAAVRATTPPSPAGAINSSNARRSAARIEPSPFLSRRLQNAVTNRRTAVERARPRACWRKPLSTGRTCCVGNGKAVAISCTMPSSMGCTSSSSWAAWAAPTPTSALATSAVGALSRWGSSNLSAMTRCSSARAWARPGSAPASIALSCASASAVNSCATSS
mmetsp:Transcript_33978/g.55381  ORF Transcript_33978/g.55381 Transcript_33978/m.55381 type:complete len:219 (-) Transcript_33978:1184-1840(-)